MPFQEKKNDSKQLTVIQNMAVVVANIRHVLPVTPLGLFETVITGKKIRK